MQICPYLFIHSLYLFPVFHLFINYLAVRQFLPSLNTQNITYTGNYTAVCSNMSRRVRPAAIHR